MSWYSERFCRRRIGRKTVVFAKLDGWITGSLYGLDMRGAHQLVNQVHVVEVARHGDGNRLLRIGHIDLQYR